MVEPGDVGGQEDVVVGKGGKDDVPGEPLRGPPAQNQAAAPGEQAVAAVKVHQQVPLVVGQGAQEQMAEA